MDTHICEVLFAASTVGRHLSVRMVLRWPRSHWTSNDFLPVHANPLSPFSTSKPLLKVANDDIVKLSASKKALGLLCTWIYGIKGLTPHKTSRAFVATSRGVLVPRPRSSLPYTTTFYIKAEFMEPEGESPSETGQVVKIKLINIYLINNIV